MCGRYTIAKPKRVAAVFSPHTIRADISRPRYNIAPMQQVPVVIAESDGRLLQDCQWGLVPDWARDRTIGSRMINARVETVAAKPAFRTAFRRSRCLIPADGFYEWQVTKSGKVPIRIHSQDGEPFAFAGLYSAWGGNASDQPLLSCVILTREADDFMSPVHDRMPVILPESLWSTWTDHEQEAEMVLKRALAEPLGRKLVMTRVSKLVNSPLNDNAQCIEAAGETGFTLSGG